MTMKGETSVDIDANKSDTNVSSDDERAVGTADSTVVNSVTPTPPVRNTSNSDDENDDSDNDGDKKVTKTFKQKACAFYWQNEFLILVVIFICIAKAYPPLGAEYLRPKITATWVAVILIFLMSGLCLKLSEIGKAFKRVYFNGFVQCYNFLAVSAMGYGVSTALHRMGALSTDLSHGMIICSCLPMTVNMVMVLTTACNGDDAAAIFNSSFGNMAGVFISPLLILFYLGVESDMKVGKVFFELALRVLLPVFVGQVIRQLFPPVVTFVDKSKRTVFKPLQQYTLIFIIYTVFCGTFAKKSQNKLIAVFLMSK